MKLFQFLPNGIARVVRGLTMLALINSVALTEGNSLNWAQDTSTEWTEPQNISKAPDLFSSNPVLLCDSNENTHLFWTEGTDNADYVYYNHDASGEWSMSNDIIASRKISFLDAAITPSGEAHLVWITDHLGQLVHASAPLAGAQDPRKWTAQQVLDERVNVSSSVYSGGNALHADSEGVLHLVYSKPDDENNLANSLYYIQSSNQGASWSHGTRVTTVVSPQPSSMTGNLAIDATGRIHIVWEVRSYVYGEFSRLGYLRSEDRGKTWESERELANGIPPFGVAMAAVFAFGEDEIHLTWDTPARLHQWSPDGGKTWSEPTGIMSLGAAFGGFNKLTKDSSGILHVIAAVGDGVFHASWDGARWSTGEALEMRAFDPHGQQLVVCQGNRLHVVYYDRTAENELWYSTRTTSAPQLRRTQIETSSDSILSITERTAFSRTSQPKEETPQAVAAREPLHNLPVPSSRGFSPILVGATSAVFVVLAVMLARLAGRRRLG